MEIKIGGGSIGLISIILIICSWFVYKSWQMVLAYALMLFILDLLLIICFIPILGVIAYYFLGKFLIIKIMAFTELSQSWLIPLIFWVNFITGIIISIGVIAVIIGWVKS